MQRNSQKNINKRLENQLIQKYTAARDLSWKLVEIIIATMHPNLTKLCGKWGIASDQLSVDVIRQHSANDDPNEIVIHLISQLDVYLNNIDRLNQEQGQSVICCIQRLFETLKLYKVNSEQLKIEDAVNEYILKLYSVFQDIQLIILSIDEDKIDSDTRASFEKHIVYAKSAIDFLVFLERQCLLLTEKGMVNNNVDTERCFQSLALVKLYNGVGNIDEAIANLNIHKEYSLKLQEPLAVAKLLEWNYLTRATIAANSGDYASARHYYSKGLAQTDVQIDGEKFDLEVIINVSDELWREFIKREMFSDALFYLRNTINLLKRNHPLNQERINKINQYQRALFELKGVLGNQQVKLINDSGKGYLEAGLLLESTSSNALLILHVIQTKFAEELLQLLQKNGIISELENENIYIHKFQHVKKDKINKIITNWIEYIQKEPLPIVNAVKAVEPKLPQPSSSQSSASATSIAETTAISASTFSSSSSAKPMTAPSVKTSTKRILKPEKILQFDNVHIYRSHDKECNVYRLYAPYSKRNYVCIARELEEQLNKKNPLALQDLKSMCEVGHVLGNSKGMKGLIIQGKPFKEMKIQLPPHTKKKQNKSSKQKQAATQNQPLYIKGKNCSKDWRFFGTSVTKKINGKDYHFFTITSWSKNHKKKAEDMTKKSEVSQKQSLLLKIT